MIETIKKYLVHFALGLITVGAVWLATINSKTFDSPEQKVEVISAVGTMPTAAERAAERATSKANDEHAIVIRQMRYEDNKKNDSINKIHERRKDSLVLDQISRQTVQIEQMKDKLNKIESHQ